MDRIYDQIISQQLAEDDMMLFLAGPRQVGKTTSSLTASQAYNNFLYLNWDEQQHRELILKGSADIATALKLNQLQTEKACIVFDEIHKYNQWKTFIKGFYDLVSLDTMRRWISTLETFYYCFTIKPWHKNITRSLLKEPKLYLWDWSIINDESAKYENFIASHLFKAVHLWTDLGLGTYELYFLRDLEKREVDFLVTKNNQPWFLVEAKRSSNHRIGKNLTNFQEQLAAPYAFQVCFDLPYIDQDCFSEKRPVIVPAITFLSQLV